MTWMLFGLIGYAFFEYQTFKEAVTSYFIMMLSLFIGWLVPMPFVNDLNEKTKNKA